MNDPTGVHPGHHVADDYRAESYRPNTYQSDVYGADAYGADPYTAESYAVDQPRAGRHRPTTPSSVAIAQRASRPCNKAVAQFGLALIAAAIVLDAAASLIDVLAGLRIVRGVPIAEVGFEYGSSLSRAADLAIPVAVLVGGAAFLWWFYCAYRARGGRVRVKHKPIWAVLGWLVPGINLIRPPQMMSELTRRSPLVRSWWTFWAVGAVAHLALRLVSPTVQRGWVYWQTAAFVADIVLLASLAVAFTLVNETSRSLSRPAYR